jgi:ATP-binding cassette, subfamily B, bacterial
MERYCVGASMAVDWGEDEDPVRVDRRKLGQVFGYFAPYRWRGTFVVACIAVQAVLGLAPAVVFKGLIDELSRPGTSFTVVLALVAAGIGAAIAGGLVAVAQSYSSTVISQGIVFEVRRRLFDALLAQPVSYFTEARAGDVLSRFNNDVNGVDDVITGAVFGLVRNALVTIATLALMFTFSWQLTLLVLVLIPLVALPTRKAGQATYQARSATQRQHGDLSAYLQEVLGISGILLVKAFGTQAFEHTRFGRLNAELRRREIHQNMIGNWFGMLMTTLQTAGPALIILGGGYLVVSGRATVGTVFVFATVLSARLAGSVTDLATMHVDITGSLALFRRLFTLIDRAPEVADAPDAAELVTADGAVGFDDVTFAYPGQQQPALTAINIDIAPGRLVALVGPSGAGKTTLTQLVARFYDPQHGRVSLDGTDVRHLTLQSLTRHIGMVFQDTFLFHASIADNLRYARPDATDEQLTAACRAANLHDFIETLPDGYDTIVGERGHRLSGGEKQRLAIARVILKDPAILILDEATSHLDSVSEQLIQAALRPLLSGRTSLVIAHRLSTVLAADQIIVLDHGEIVDRGTHTELLTRGGLYQSLYEQQFHPQSPTTAPTPLPVHSAQP